MIVLHDVGHAALARLAVHPDDGLVRAAHVVRVDGQVGRLPVDLVDRLPGRCRLLRQRLEPLLDGVLVGAGERRVHEVAGVRVSRMHLDAGAVLDGAAHLVDVGEVDLRVDALGEEVHGERDQVDVAGAFAVAEQAALDAVGARHEGQFGGGDGRAAVVVRVQADAHVLAVADVANEVLDLVGVRVGGAHLDRGGQVEDDLAARVGLPDVRNAVADLDGELGGRLGEDLRAVLIAELDVAQVLLGVLHDQFGASGGHGDALGLVDTEHHAAEELRGRVVQVDVGALDADQRLRRARDEVLAGLGEDGDLNVVGDAVLDDQLADEVEVGLRGGREADLDLFVAQLDEQVEHLHLAGRGHRVDERLVAVAEVGRQPAGSVGDLLGGPGTVGDIDRLERPVAVERHRAGLLGWRPVLRDGAEGGDGGHGSFLRVRWGMPGACKNSATRKPDASQDPSAGSEV